MAVPKGRIHKMSPADWERAFPNDASCASYLIKHRWPEGVQCPRCGSTKVTEITGLKNSWRCASCAADGGGAFSVCTGTPFENSNRSLQEWFKLIHMMLHSEKVILPLRVQRMFNLDSYIAAWRMAHAVRVGIADENFRKIMGISDKRRRRKMGADPAPLVAPLPEPHGL